MAMIVGVAGRWIIQLPKADPYYIKLTSGQVKISSVWLWAVRAALLFNAAIGLGMIAASALGEAGMGPVAILGMMLVATGLIGFIANSLPRHHEKFDIFWDERTITGPRSPISAEPVTLRWEDLTGYNRGNLIFSQLEGSHGRTLYWTPLHVGHRVIAEAIARNRPDLIDKR